MYTYQKYLCCVTEAVLSSFCTMVKPSTTLCLIVFGEACMPQTVA